MKKLFSLLVAAAMLLGIFGVTASAEAYSWEDWDYYPGHGSNWSRTVDARFYLLNEGLEEQRRSRQKIIWQQAGVK